MATKLKIRVGRQAIRRTLNPDEAGYTRSIRAQVKNLEKAWEFFISQVDDVLPKILEEALQPTFDLSQKYVPVKSGRLKASGLFEVKTTAKKPRVELSYGKGGEPPYAVIVHEFTHLNHKSPTRAKYLQAAVEEDLGKVMERITTALIPTGG